MASKNLYWGKWALRRSLGALLLCFTALAGAQEPNGDDASVVAAEASAPSLLDQTFDFDVPAQKVSTAILDIARQANVQTLMTGNVLDNYQTEGLQQRMSLSAALERVLSGTQYSYRQTGSNAIMVGMPDALAAVPEDPKGLAVLAEENAGAAADAEAMDSTTASVETTRRGGIEEIIVTGQKRAERIQDVPIAISAFSMEDLDNQKVEGGFDLLKAVPNVTFSKTNFSGYNFQIRGIGTQAISATTDPGVAVSFNNTTLIVNRLFEQEYLDVERVEVLRGPQGTLYGRNATAGVINLITSKPEMGVYEGQVKGEIGNYNAQRVRGHYNFPLNDDNTLAGRVAYAWTKRDGFGENEAASQTDAAVRADVDGRDLWTGRFTLGWEPTEKSKINLLYERFEEDDNRVRTSKQLCHRDTGARIAAFPDSGRTGITPDGFADASTYYYGPLSQGCKAGSLYADEAFGTPNGTSLPYVSAPYWATYYGETLGSTAGNIGGYGLGGNPWHPSQWDIPGTPPADLPCQEITERVSMFPVDICNPDVYRGRMQSTDLRTIYSLIEPTYQAKSDIYELSFDQEWTDDLLFSSQTVYARDEYYASQDYNRFAAFPIWNDSLTSCGIDGGGGGIFSPPPTVNCSPDRIGNYANGFYSDLTPGGIFCDPQLGCSDSLIAQDLSQSSSKQFNQEFRLVSSFDGPMNFSIGANYTRFETLNDYYVFANGLTLLTSLFPFNYHNSLCELEDTFCRYVDPNPLNRINGEGHNYFRSSNPYKLTSSAIFGEAYWQVIDNLKVTVGLRMTWDEKVFTPIPSQLLLGDYREAPNTQLGGLSVSPGDGPENCRSLPECPLSGNAPGGRGSPADPDIVQQWREPTGRLVVDWSPLLPFTDETLFYASYSHGYKGGGANPPSIAAPAKFTADRASGGTADTFKAEYVDAFEIGTKNTLFGGAVTLNATAFYYDYKDYQVSKIIDRRAVNENFDSTLWGLELESMIAPTPSLLFNVAVGYLRTSVGDGEESIDLMDRTDGGNRYFAAAPGAMTSGGETSDFPDGFNEWVVIQPWITASSNCIVPRKLIEANIYSITDPDGSGLTLNDYCPTGNFAGTVSAKVPYFDANGNILKDRGYYPEIDAPNGGAGFSKDLSGNDLPNAPRWTVSVGGQYTFYLPANVELTTRADFYWQDESYARIYNMPDYDRLKDWTSTNLSVWMFKPDWGLKVEAYVKNLLDETPITGSFLNSDDSGLTTNIFTLDPRLFGLAVTKSF